MQTISQNIFANKDHISNTYFDGGLTWFFYSFVQGLLSLTWFNFDPDMEKSPHNHSTLRWNYLSIHKLQLYTRWNLGINK